MYTCIGLNNRRKANYINLPKSALAVFITPKMWAATRKNYTKGKTINQ